VFGIVNGIDTDVWNPAPTRIWQPLFGNLACARAANRRAVEERFGLDDSGDPDLLRHLAADLAEGHGRAGAGHRRYCRRGARLVVLGSGDQRLEGDAAAAASHYRGRVGVVTGYSEGSRT
jgi:starch synthase